ncbi:hypothetical protein CDV31_009686 [Fusarium ambrosium]|uniref:Uncharacterized protein n=1 Tax=Fusarium ambrosium TaxID=131363 RepID=A0A428TSS3_9HYPO|nr:hypothetical protein CDV31_009686 [Fusarium ambrosium]
MPPLVTPVNTQSDDVTRESGKEITAATDMSAPEKDALHDLLERWVAMRPSNGTTALSITTIFVCEAARIEQYNKALIIALARLHILAFAKTGTQEIPSINDAHRVNGRIKMVELASDHSSKSPLTSETSPDCVRLRVGQPR